MARSASVRPEGFHARRTPRNDLLLGVAFLLALSSPETEAIFIRCDLDSTLHRLVSLNLSWGTVNQGGCTSLRCPFLQYQSPSSK